MENRRIALIGCGNLGLTLVNGLLDSSDISPSNIWATRRNTAALKTLADKGVNITSDNIEAVKNSDIVLLSVKPYNVEPILSEISNSLDPKRHILICVATGVTLNEISTWAGKSLPIFRAMPNTAAEVKESATAICSINANSEQEQAVTGLFESIGITLHIDESLMESATILGACGIAYVLRFIRAMIQGGIEVGFDAKTASEIVSQTVKGASELLIQKGAHPESEIDKVTTPKGCTITGLNEMEHAGFSSALIKGIVASYKKIEKD